MTQSFTAKNEKPMAAPLAKSAAVKNGRTAFVFFFGNPSRTDSYKGLKFSRNIPNRLPMGSERVLYD